MNITRKTLIHVFFVLTYISAIAIAFHYNNLRIFYYEQYQIYSNFHSFELYTSNYWNMMLYLIIPMAGMYPLYYSVLFVIKCKKLHLSMIFAIFGLAMSVLLLFLSRINDLEQVSIQVIMYMIFLYGITVTLVSIYKINRYY